MRNVELQVPLRVYTRSGALIAQIGEQRRIPVQLRPDPGAREARLSRRRGRPLLRAPRRRLLRRGARGCSSTSCPATRRQGASTITMQAARNMFLSLDKTARRKLQEIFVTYRMEHEFTKEEILGALPQRDLLRPARLRRRRRRRDLLRQDARRARRRRGGHARRHSEGALALQPDHQPAGGHRAPHLRAAAHARAATTSTRPTAEAANRSRCEARAHAPLFDVEAPYVAEMVRLELRQRFGAAAESAGYKVYTTIDSRLQGAPTAPCASA